MCQRILVFSLSLGQVEQYETYFDDMIILAHLNLVNIQKLSNQRLIKNVKDHAQRLLNLYCSSYLTNTDVVLLHYSYFH